jgi:Arc/MetJ family transcription regulator
MTAQTTINIVLNDELLSEALRLSHVQTTNEVIELALQEFVALRKRRNMKHLFGKVQWDADVENG